jgi:hypothetical protein
MHVRRTLAPEGEYSSKNFEQQLARDRFFEYLCAIEKSKEMKAAPIAELRKSVYPLFAAVQPETHESVASELFCPMFDALFAWASAFNLTVKQDSQRVPPSWVWRATLLTLYVWHRWEPLRAHGPPPVWAGGAIYTEFDFLKQRASQSPDEFSFSLSGPKPDPLREKFAAFRARVIGQLEPLLKAQWESVVEKTVTSDVVKWKPKRKHKHFHWLCLYQIDQWSYEQIVNKCRDAEGLDTTTVRRGVEAAALLIGLDLRPGRRGSVRKSGVSS